MILASDVYNLLLDITREDKRGNAFSIDEFNRVAKIVNQKVFDKYYAQFEESVANSDALGRFKKFDQPLSLGLNALATARTASLPSDCLQLIGRPRSVDSGTYRPLDICTTLEVAERNDDYLTAPSTTYPICQLGGLDASDNGKIMVYPPTITTIYIDYLRSPEIPFLDYYVNNTTFNYTFMAEGATVLVPATCTARTGVSGINVTSATINFEWDEAELALIVALFMQYIGVQLPDQMLLQAGTAEEIKTIE